MARPKKTVEEKIIDKIENDFIVIEPEIRTAGFHQVAKITPEQFLISKGIDPAIKEAPIQNITFVQLTELMDEYKNL